MGDDRMRHESKSAASCIWCPPGLRVLAHRVWRGVRSVLFVGQAGVAGLSRVRESGSQPEGSAVPGAADGAHRAQTGVLSDRGAQVRMPGMRPAFRGHPPFAPAYASLLRQTYGLRDEALLRLKLYDRHEASSNFSVSMRPQLPGRSTISGQTLEAVQPLQR